MSMHKPDEDGLPIGVRASVSTQLSDMSAAEAFWKWAVVPACLSPGFFAGAIGRLRGLSLLNMLVNMPEPRLEQQYIIIAFLRFECPMAPLM